MDTMLLYPEKRLLNAVGITVNILLVAYFAHLFTMPIMANDLIANLSVPNYNVEQVKNRILNETSMETRAKNFDKRIKEKYPKNAVITNVDVGIKHIKLVKYYDGKPVRINVVEIDKKLAEDYEITPQLASTTLQNKQTISTIAKNSNSKIALNGTFFKPQTGVPLGTLMINKKMLTGPVYDRVAFGIFENGYDIARVKLNAKIKTQAGEIPIDNINQPRMLSTYTLCYTSEWGEYAPPSPKYGLQIAVENNKIKEISSKALKIPTNGFIIVAPSDKLNSLKLNDKVSLSIETNPEWKDVKHIISGGPYLVKNGEIFIDMTAEKLGAIGGKNPRSAIGYTKDNNLILVAVDGREGSSVGMTLVQLANFMKSIGCTAAINLDGGSSTVMYVDGKIVNKPQHSGGIPISNAIVISKKI